MATACAAETDLQMGEAALLEPRYVEIDQTIDAAEESEDFTIGLKKVDDGLVESCEGFVFVVTPWVVGAAAIEHVASSVAAVIGGNAFLEGEGIDVDDQRGLMVVGQIGVVVLQIGGHLAPRCEVR